MWEKYFKLRSSDAYVTMWTVFLHESISVKASPIFFQLVTDQIMEKLIKEHFPVASTVYSNNPTPPDYLDKNTLRYTVGSVVRSLQKKVERGAHPLKELILLCLNDIKEDGGKIFW